MLNMLRFELFIGKRRRKFGSLFLSFLSVFFIFNRLVNYLSLKTMVVEWKSCEFILVKVCKIYVCLHLELLHDFQYTLNFQIV